MVIDELRMGSYWFGSLDYIDSLDSEDNTAAAASRL